MDLLKRGLAPIVSEAWEEIDQEAKRVLSLNLGGRKVVDFDGPHGWSLAAVNKGRVTAFKKAPVAGVSAALRMSQPLVELRAPFRLSIAELDVAARGGAEDIDLDEVVKAAEKIAQAEDSAIFHGYREAGITGIVEASPHKPLTIPAPAKYPQVIVEAREVLREAGINGPYALALGTRAFKEISQATDDGYPIRKLIDKQVIDGPLVHAPALQGAVLLSMRGGDYTLTVGQDLSIGFASTDYDNVELYLVESFTFRIHDEGAAVALQHK